MEKKIQDVVKFVTDKKNRTTVIAAAAGVAVITAIAAVMTKRGGKTKR